MPVLNDEIAARLGVLPNFFRLAPDAPSISKNMWMLAKFAYLDSPLPSLFKERLFVHLSRYCEVRYCVARHFCFLVGRGYPAGDSLTTPMRIEEAVTLLMKSYMPHTDPERQITILRNVIGPLKGEIKPDGELETALMGVCTAVFLNPQKAQPYLPVLRRVMGSEEFEYLLLFIGFVRMAHYWTQVHPDLKGEEDVNELMNTLEGLAWGLAWDSQAGWSVLATQMAEELENLKHLGGNRHDPGRAPLR